MKLSLLLKPFTYEKCHAFYRNYQPDPQMWGEMIFTYQQEQIDQYYRQMVLNPTRRFFAICLDETVIGEIQLKKISFEKGEATLSIHLQKDEYKNKGYGTWAEKMIIEYAFNHLGLHTVYADAVKQNTRSRRALKKAGFVYIREDEDFIYFEIKKQ